MSFSWAFQCYHFHLDPIWPDGTFKAQSLFSNYGYSAKSAPHLVDVSRVLIYEGGSTRNTVHPLLHLPRLSVTGLSCKYFTLH
jgi:hypothetical protein